MTIYDSLIAKAIGGSGGGGGGSSDFSTATLSISSELTDVEFECISISISDEESMTSGIYLPSGNGDVTVVLYQGQGLLLNTYEYSMSLSGDIVYDAELDAYVITGDCAVTVS